MRLPSAAMPDQRESGLGVDVDVVGLGNAIVDVLASVPDSFVSSHGLVKGIMRLCSDEEAEALYAAMPPGTEKSGGSAANTMVGVASFGGRSAFVGKVRDDQLGRVFAHDIAAAGVAFDTPMAAASSALPTARCLVLVTPDAQRTLNTSLGVAGRVSVGDVPDALVPGAGFVFLEGFLWEEPSAREAMLHAASVARGGGSRCRVAFSLSDPFCVDRNRSDFVRFVTESVDVLFANEDELVSLFSADDVDDALSRVESLSCSFVAVTRGPLGSVLVVDGGAPVVVDAAPADVVDTTGAGDLYAAGVLYGLSRGFEPAAAGRLGSLAAAEVISHLGARPERSLRDLLSVL